MSDRPAVSLPETPFSSTTSSRSRANCVEKKGSKIKGCVVEGQQTRMAQGFSQLHDGGSDYTRGLQAAWWCGFSYYTPRQAWIGRHE